MQQAESRKAENKGKATGHTLTSMLLPDVFVPPRHGNKKRSLKMLHRNSSLPPVASVPWLHTNTLLKYALFPMKGVNYRGR